MAYAATCTDCGWSFRHAHREPVSEALERHGRKEQHHVRFVRAPVDAPA